MNIIEKCRAIRNIMDSIFVSDTVVKPGDIIKCDEHDGIIYEAVVLDPSCDAFFRFDRNADGSYFVKEVDIKLPLESERKRIPMNEQEMVRAFKIKCEQVIEEAKVAVFPGDVECAYATYCEAEGMADIMQAGYGKPLLEANRSLFEALSEAWSAWDQANDRVCYDPVTGCRCR